jgi:hypothetical protein
VYIYASILNACAFSFGSEEIRAEALSIAREVFQECKQRNDVVYGAFLKACNSLMDRNDERCLKLIKDVFAECRERGFASNFVLNELFSSLSPGQYQMLVGSDSQENVSTRDIPKRWCRNITKK